MFGGYWSSAIEDKKYLICHVTLQKHMIKGLFNFLSGYFSWCVTTLTNLVAIRIVVVEYNVFSLPHDPTRPHE